MKTIGIIGGIAPESTIEYYRSIIRLYRERARDGTYPPILINSIDLKRVLDLVGAQKLAELTEYVLGEVRKLARAGADLGLLASNTPHVVFDDIRRSSPIPLVSIVEATCRATQALGLKKVGLFGTLQGFLHADGLYRVSSFLKAGRIPQAHRHSVDDKNIFDSIPGGSRNRRHDGALTAEQAIHQAGLTHVGASDNGNREAFPNHPAVHIHANEPPHRPYHPIVKLAAQGLAV